MRANKQPKLILNNALLEEEFFEEVAIIGLVCAQKPHQLVWHIQQALAYPFSRNHDCEVYSNDVYYPVFSYEEILRQTEHFIFTNRNKTDYLLPEAKNVDFIWLIKSSSYLNMSKALLMNTLPQIPVIDYLFEINHATLKSRQHLII